MANDHRKDFGNSLPNFVTKQDLGMAKPSRYAVDGIGRDTYIELNNGGLYRNHRPASAMTVGTFVQAKRTEFNLCNMGSKRSNYHYNGSGRDSYIG